VRQLKLKLNSECRKEGVSRRGFREEGFVKRVCEEGFGLRI
jgi:hypothetical protein